MSVSMDPAALGQGAARFAGKDEELRRDVTNIADLIATLPAAFGGELGQAMLRTLEPGLAQVRSQVEAVRALVANAGSVVGSSAEVLPAIDQDNGRAISANSVDGTAVGM